MAQVDRDPIERIVKGTEVNTVLYAGPMIVSSGTVEFSETTTLTVDDDLRPKKFSSWSVKE